MITDRSPRHNLPKLIAELARLIPMLAKSSSDITQNTRSSDARVLGARIAVHVRGVVAGVDGNHPRVGVLLREDVGEVHAHTVECRFGGVVCLVNNKIAIQLSSCVTGSQVSVEYVQ
jgi:hypothetical protein